MSWNQPASAYQQPDDTQGRDATGNSTRVLNFKGPHADLEAAAKLLADGDVIESAAPVAPATSGAALWLYASHELRRVAGGLGILAITCKPPDPTSVDPETYKPVVEPLKEVWSIKAQRNDVSVMAYCGPSAGGNPCRALVEAWMKEPDGRLAAAHQYRDENGSIVDVESISPVSVELINKIEKGIEQVVRFHPVVTRVLTYASCPPGCLDDLGYISDPPAPGATAKAAGGLASRITELKGKWLKMQDDVQEQPDGNWTRTESWWGAPDGWDADLYGANRWSMPYLSGAAAQQGGGGGNA